VQFNILQFFLITHSADSSVAVDLSEDVPLRVMPMNTLDNALIMPRYGIFSRAKDTFFIIDEECDCLKGKPYNLSEVIKHTSNYYVTISRDRFSDIPYSVYSIYELAVQPNPEYSKLFIENQEVSDVCTGIQKTQTHCRDDC
jgi:hypothetical protein